MHSQGFPPRHTTSRIGLIGPAAAQPHARVAEVLQPRLPAVAVLHASRCHDHDQDRPKRIDEEVPRAACDLFGCIEALAPPFSVVFTD
jgi:hypothetical protein